MSKHERDDGLGEEIGHGAVEHAAERADAVVKHALEVSLAPANKVALERRGFGVALADGVAVVAPDYGISYSSVTVPHHR